MPTPTDAECGAVKPSLTGENGRRLMSTTCASGRCSNVRGSGYDAIHLWDATQAAYMTPGEDANTGDLGACKTGDQTRGEWECLEVYEWDNARAVLIKHKNNLVLSISGTDGITALKDWGDNLNKGINVQFNFFGWKWSVYNNRPSLGGKKVHKGFYDYTMKIKDLILYGKGRVAARTMIALKCLMEKE